MTDRPLVSVVIPVYNGTNYLAQAVAGLTLFFDPAVQGSLHTAVVGPEGRTRFSIRRWANSPAWLADRPGQARQALRAASPARTRKSRETLHDRRR